MVVAQDGSAVHGAGEDDVSNSKFRIDPSSSQLDIIRTTSRFGGTHDKENVRANGGGLDEDEDDFELMAGLDEQGLLDDEEMGLLEGPELNEDDYLMPLGVDDAGGECAGAADGGEDSADGGEAPPPEPAAGPAAASVNVNRGNANRGNANVIPDRELLLPQRDALHATERYITVTGLDSSERVYAPVRAGSGMGSGSLSEALRRSKGNMLATKIDDLLGMVERDQFERVLAETKAAKRRAKAEKKQKGQAAATQAEAGLSSGPSSSVPVLSKQLWVEKYAPAGFLDLLSDELINREVVKWVKEWDTCVFGGSAQNAVGSNNGNLALAQDPLSRPEHKIILLAGPPGLGKTTLAHIVAKHCGYKPMEINASDARSGPALVGKVVDAMEMGRVTVDKRPNCVIIDEIDGASGGGEGRSAVAALVKLATAKVVRKAKDERKTKEVDLEGVGAGEDQKRGSASASAGASKGQPLVKPLTRPVICICNDLYAPVLRPLRDVAKVFVVKPPRSEKLVERLQVICKKEKLKADKSTLRGLVEKTECDIRSCLNTMQFISKKQKTMKMSDISSVGAGQKDISVGAFRLWKELLHLRQGPSVIGKVAETDSQRCLRRYNTLSDFGDQDLVLGGIYESLPSIILFDMALTKTSTVLENIQMVDCMQKRVNRNQEFALMKYLPACTLRVASVLAGPENPMVRWPRMLQGARKDMIDREMMVHKWRLGMKPETYASLAKTAAMLDVLPFLPWLTAPVLRPVSRHLYSSEERKNLEKVVDVMLSLGFEFSLDDEGDAAGAGGKRTNVLLNPPLHSLWQFEHADFVSDLAESQTIAKPRDVPLPTRQMVMHELDMERIKRAAKEKQQRGGAGGTHAGGADPAPSSQTPSRAFTGAVPTTLAQRLEENKKHRKSAGPAKPARKRNWLEQLKDSAKETATVTCTQGGTVTAGKKARAEDTAVLYKFHEGYTNAVRKPVSIFLL